MSTRRKQGASGDAAQRVEDALDSLPAISTSTVLSEKSGIPKRVWENYRHNGGGPVFRRRGHPTRGRVVYLKGDVIAWVRNLPAATTTTEERIRVEACAAGV